MHGFSISCVFPANPEQTETHHVGSSALVHCTKMVHHSDMNYSSLDRQPPERLVDHLSTAILVVNAGGELIWMNASAEILLGVSARQVLGLGMDALWPQASELNLATREVAGGGQSMEFRALSLSVNASAEALSVDCVISAMPARGGTEQVVIEMQLSNRGRTLVRDADRNAQQHLAQRMVHNLAHELRNPLAGLRGAAQLLERKLSQRELKDYTRIIIGEADRLGALVSQLLGPQQAPRRTPVNLHRPLEHVRRLVAAEQADGIRIERDYDPSLPKVEVDADQLIQALLNLLRNACQALTDTPGARIRLRSRVAYNLVIGGISHRQCARISVIDNGPGIAPDLLERIFFPMVSGHPQRTGLGLSIARSLISANGGRLDCNSRAGRTEFFIDLPLDSHP